MNIYTRVHRQWEIWMHQHMFVGLSFDWMQAVNKEKTIIATLFAYHWCKKGEEEGENDERGKRRTTTIILISRTRTSMNIGYNQTVPSSSSCLDYINLIVYKNNLEKIKTQKKQEIATYGWIRLLFLDGKICVIQTTIVGGGGKCNRHFCTYINHLILFPSSRDCSILRLFLIIGNTLWRFFVCHLRQRDNRTMINISKIFVNLVQWQTMIISHSQQWSIHWQRSNLQGCFLFMSMSLNKRKKAISQTTTRRFFQQGFLGTFLMSRWINE